MSKRVHCPACKKVVKLELVNGQFFCIRCGFTITAEEAEREALAHAIAGEHDLRKSRFFGALARRVPPGVTVGEYFQGREAELEALYQHIVVDGGSDHA